MDVFREEKSQERSRYQEEVVKERLRKKKRNEGRKVYRDHKSIDKVRDRDLEDKGTANEMQYHHPRAKHKKESWFFFIWYMTGRGRPGTTCTRPGERGEAARHKRLID